ncbi:MAG TPA: hypothetical protein VNJ04_00105 [Gemmatimonadaceae bacterium]|nr:hypothetical protein [Gemmatimonadaceae bacterium]
MSNPDKTFITADDAYLARVVGEANDRLVFIGPGLGKATATALIEAIGPRGIATTIILDADADAARIGYGDPEALESLHAAVTKFGYAVRRQAGLRIGLLVTDRTVVIWSPTPRAVEAERGEGQPNAIVLSGAAVQTIENAVGADHGGVPPLEAEIGRDALTPADLAATVEELRKNPAAPFDLARRARVFSTRFQFVEPEIRGAEWTQRRMKVSNFLLNADLSEELQEVLETQIRPFQATGDVEINVPLLVRGKPAYERNGSRMLAAATQAQVLAAWTETQRRYLRNVKGFGWLIRRDQLEAFRTEVTAYEEMLSACDLLGVFRTS